MGSIGGRQTAGLVHLRALSNLNDSVIQLLLLYIGTRDEGGGRTDH